MQFPSIKLIFLKLRPVLRWFFKHRGSPKAVAGGFGLGLFIALTPTVGVQVLLALALATFLNLNRVAAVVPVWITNPITIPPLFTFNYWIGSLIWPGTRVGDVYRQLLKIAANMATLNIWEIGAQMEALALLGKDIFIPLVIGSILVGGCAGYLGYFTLLKLFAWFSMRREKKRRKILRKM